ncbi:hypothetical protein P7K49_009054 [Saguinus oedipus]|uniref:Uncharacterized protein n=1 Tax=Saguinus oedipus TaxID=9490 RepID=A0ABQ9W1X5_SAGOE|nr:hypothetical protein P7K49_009054 [Saguinus oedipus]
MRQEEKYLFATGLRYKQLGPLCRSPRGCDHGQTLHRAPGAVTTDRLCTGSLWEACCCLAAHTEHWATGGLPNRRGANSVVTSGDRKLRAPFIITTPRVDSPKPRLPARLRRPLLPLTASLSVISSILWPPSLVSLRGTCACDSGEVGAPGNPQSHLFRT